MDVDAYLERIGYAGPREPSEDTLVALHRAHMLAVPFENLDIHLGVANVLDPEHVFDKIVTRRRGGWCYELNGLFALLLESLGFAVTRYSASVVVSDPPSPDFAHLTLRVDLDRPWLADVGFGASFTRPLRLDDDGDQERDGSTYRVARGPDGRMVLHENGSPSTPSRSSRAGWSEFAEMCVLQQTSPAPTSSRRRCAPSQPRTAARPSPACASSPRRSTAAASASWKARRNEPPSCATLFGVDLGRAEFVPSSTSLE